MHSITKGTRDAGPPRATVKKPSETITPNRRAHILTILSHYPDADEKTKRRALLRGGVLEREVNAWFRSHKEQEGDDEDG